MFYDTQLTENMENNRKTIMMYCIKDRIIDFEFYLKKNRYYSCDVVSYHNAEKNITYYMFRGELDAYMTLDNEGIYYDNISEYFVTLKECRKLKLKKLYESW